MIRLEVIRVLRRLRSSPRFAIAVIASVAFAVGPVVVAASAYEAIFLRDVAARENSRELVRIRSAIRVGSGVNARGVSYPDYQDLRASLPTALWRFMTAWTVLDASRTTSTGDRPLRLAGVAGDYFQIANARFIRGNPPPTDGDGVVVRQTLWRQLVTEGRGKYLEIYGRRFPVTGVIDDAFRGLYPDEGVDAWMLLTTTRVVEGDANALSYREREHLSVLIATASEERARSIEPALTAISANLVESHKNLPAWHLEASSASPSFPELLRTPRGQAAFGSVLVLACVLLLAAANIADLFVIRTASRRAESQLRLALGLPRGRLLLYECLEPLLLSLAGLALGLGAGVFALHRLSEVRLLGRLGLALTSVGVAAACAAALLFAGVCAAFPAITISRVRPAGITNAGVGVTSRGAARMQRLFLVVQFMFALGFTYVAVQLASAVRQQGAVNVGFDTQNLLVVRGAHGDNGRTPAQWASDFNRVVGAVSSVAGVRSVSGSVSEFFGGYRPAWRELTLSPATSRHVEPALDADMHVVATHYFETLGLPLIAGREFGAEEVFGAPKNVLVNRTLARLIAGNGTAVGKTIYELGEPRTIVGVVPDIRATAAEVVSPTLYRSFTETPLPVFVLYARVTTPSPAVRSAISAAVAGALPASAGRLEIHTAEEQRQQRDLPALAMFWLSAGLAALTLLVAGLGLYSVASYAVATRKREHGIRSALGASPARLARMVIADGLRWTAVATFLSLPAIWLGFALVRKLVVGARPVPLFAAAVVAGAYVLLILLSLALPARTLASLSPAETIRSA